MMNEINQLKEPKPVIQKQASINKYSMHKIINSDNEFIDKT